MAEKVSINAATDVGRRPQNLQYFCVHLLSEEGWMIFVETEQQRGGARGAYDCT
jgi:hypothetical protein